ncbi:hypothetical protein GCM10027341_04860 [Spirosoma knui]
MWHTLARVIDYLDTVPPLFLLVLALTSMGWGRRDYILYYLGCQFLFNGYANFLNELKRDNLFAYSLNFAWTNFLLSQFFIKLYSNRYFTWLLLLSTLLYQVNVLSTTQTASTTATFDSSSFGLVSLLMTLYCIVYYTKQLSQQPTENILTVRNFWYVNGLFTYYTSNFFIFLTYNALTKMNVANIVVIWRVHNVVFLIMCVYFFVGLRCKTSPGE